MEVDFNQLAKDTSQEFVDSIQRELNLFQDYSVVKVEHSVDSETSTCHDVYLKSGGIVSIHSFFNFKDRNIPSITKTQVTRHEFDALKEIFEGGE